MPPLSGLLPPLGPAASQQRLLHPSQAPTAGQAQAEPFHCISVTSSLGEEQCQPPCTDGESKARGTSGCPRSLHELRVHKLEPSAMWLGNPALSTSPPGPPPPGTNRPLDFCGTYCRQHFIPSCQAPSSWHMWLPTSGWVSSQQRAWVLPRLLRGRNTNVGHWGGGQRGKAGDLCQAWSPFHPALGFKD